MAKYASTPSLGVFATLLNRVATVALDSGLDLDDRWASNSQCHLFLYLLHGSQRHHTSQQVILGCKRLSHFWMIAQTSASGAAGAMDAIPQARLSIT